MLNINYYFAKNVWLKSNCNTVHEMYFQTTSEKVPQKLHILNRTMNKKKSKKKLL